MSSSNTCLLHPVAAFQIAEHATRVSAVKTMTAEEISARKVHKPVSGREIGLLLGRLNFNRIEVQSTIQLLIVGEDEQLKINSECFNDFYGNYCESFSNESHQILGWYSVDDASSKQRKLMYNLVSDFIKTELSLNMSKLVYLEFTSGTGTPFIAYIVENEGSEKINLESLSAPEELSAVRAMTENLSYDERRKLRALPYEKLASKLRKLKDYLNDVKDKPALYNPDIVRRCNDVSLRFYKPDVSVEANSLKDESALMLLSTMLLQKSCRANR